MEFQLFKHFIVRYLYDLIDYNRFLPDDAMMAIKVG